MQKRELIATLLPFAGQKVTIMSVMGDAEGDRFKQDFLEVLRATKWSFNEATDVSQGVMMPTPQGVQVTINQTDAQPERVLKSAVQFMLLLHKIGITNSDTIFVNNDVPSGQVRLIVGTKPPYAQGKK